MQDGDQTENKVPEPDQAQPEVRDQAYVQEIASEVNRLYALRGEPTRLSPEKVGHRLKKLGLVTRPLSQAGHGRRFDSATLARIEQLAAVYMVEDTQAETAKLEDARKANRWFEGQEGGDGFFALVLRSQRPSRARDRGRGTLEFQAGSFSHTDRTLAEKGRGLSRNRSRQ